MSPRLTLCACLVCVGQAAELPAPARLCINRWDALAAWRLELPVGLQRFTCPAAVTRVRVAGARSWRIEDLPDEPATQPDGAAVALLAERDRLMAEAQVLEAATAADQALRERLAKDLVRSATRGDGEAQRWQEALDGVLAASRALAESQARHRQARHRLESQARQLTGRDAWLQLHQGPARLDPAEVPRPLLRPSRRELVIECDRPGVVQVDGVCALRWEPLHRLDLEGPTATLQRQARVLWDRDPGLGRVPVLLTTALPDGPNEGPTPRPVALRSLLIGAGAGHSGGSQEAGGSWGASFAASERSLSTPAIDAAAPAPIPAGEASGPDPAPAPAGHPPSANPVEYAVGELLIAGPDGPPPITCASSRLAVEADELALMPGSSRVAVRHLALRLDDRPLGEGVLELRERGRLLSAGQVAAQPPGGLIHLAGDEDQRLFVGDACTWPVQPSDAGERHRRQGYDRWVFNLGQEPVTVRVYLTMPVSRSAGIEVEPDPGTSPGGQAIAPGLMRWEAVISPGTPQRFALGWTVRAGDGLTLPPPTGLVPGLGE